MAWREVVDRVEHSVAPGQMLTRVVAVDGQGGAGKSTLAGRLAASLGDAPIIHTDDFASWEHPLDWWPRLLGQVLQPLSHNGVARYQRYDWPSREMAEWHEVSPGGFVVLEGVSALREAFRPTLAFGIWVCTPRKERLRRGLQRDGVDAHEQWLAWMAAEDDYVRREDPAAHADLIISGTDHLP